MITLLYTLVNVAAMPVQTGWITLTHSQVKTSPRTLMATCIGVRTTPTMTAKATCAASTMPAQTAWMTPQAAWNAAVMPAQTVWMTPQAAWKTPVMAAHPAWI